ncbi:MAG: NAD(P)H-dependent oxidoreductase subunit E, partial [Bacteroidetes bacterium]|nr:NAD(P)H-dependent oxidoreductase subunit E [Bacteroidota bacterium]
MRVARIQTELKEPKDKDVADLSLLDSLIRELKEKKGNLIPLLQGTQDIYGYIPREAFKKISEETGIELSDMYGVVIFYAQFRLNPVGKYIVKVCHGTACHVQNANIITDSLK